MDAKALRRAGLDYHEFAEIKIHPNWPAAKAVFAGKRLFAITTKGRTAFHDARFMPDDVLVFGPETRGLPAKMLDEFTVDTRLRLPMRADSRSLNLSNTVAVAVYEAWRQLAFIGASGQDLPSK